MAKKANPAKALIYQLKITLRHSSPPIWRRVLVPAGFTLSKLHDIIQVSMGWEDYHLHQFTICDQFFGEPSDDDWAPILDERRYSLAKLALDEKARFIYEYDFGDSWEHLVTVEKILPAESGKIYPVCIKGKRACPPEDVGGVWGYEEFLLAISDPDHEEHESYIEWAGDGFDSEECNLDEINSLLRRIT